MPTIECRCRRPVSRSIARQAGRKCSECSAPGHAICRRTLSSDQPAMRPEFQTSTASERNLNAVFLCAWNERNQALSLMLSRTKKTNGYLPANSKLWSSSKLDFYICLMRLMCYLNFARKIFHFFSTFSTFFSSLKSDRAFKQLLQFKTFILWLK